MATKFDVHGCVLPQLWGGGYLANCCHSATFWVFQNNQNTSSVFDILFMFDRGRRSLAAATTVKYERDLKKK